MTELTPSQVNDLVQRYIRQSLGADEQARNNDKEPFDVSYYEDHKAILGAVRGLLKGRLASNDREFITETVDGLLQAEGITLDKDSPVYNLLCREMFKAEDYITGIMEKRHQGDYSQDPSWTPGTPITQGADRPKPGKTLTEVREQFIEEGRAEGRWSSEKSISTVWASQQVLIDYFGDVPINSLEREQLGHFKRDLWKIPPNRNKPGPLQGLTIHDVIKLDLPKKKCIKELTVSKYLGWASTLFEHARVYGLITQNPMEGMKIKKTKRDSERRAIWTTDELERIFGAPGYTKDKFRLSYQYWTPLLALFTGARQEEISNLRLTDFEQHEGVWCLNILADDGKKLKNMASRRLIPLHPTLIDLGVMRRYDHMKAAGQTRFMPDLKPKGERYGPYVSTWFNDRFKKKLGFETNTGKDFHSFRHTFGTNLGHNEINDHHLKALMGHAESGITFDYYVKRGTLRPCINH